MANYQQGYNSKIRISNVAYAVAHWSVRWSGADLDVTNTEGLPGNTGYGTTTPGYANRICGIQDADVSLRQATFDTVTNVFAGPPLINVGVYLNLNIFPAGTGGVKWAFPNLLVLTMDNDGDVKGLMPVSCTGRADGQFTCPSA